MTSEHLYNGDCLDCMEWLPEGGVDMILCDLPYGTTRNKWDCPLPLDKLWCHYKRLIKSNGAIVLFAQTPFDKVLGASNLDMLKYEWIWEKAMATGRLNCNFAPLKQHENILVFSKSAASYVKDKQKAMAFNPQFTTGKPYTCKTGRASTNYSTKWHRQVITENKGVRYPKSILKFQHDKHKLHPTQKPVALLEYLIKTYTNEGETVLDNCMGSGSTGVACVNTGRNFIGIELDRDYYETAIDRIKTAKEDVKRNENSLD